MLFAQYERYQYARHPLVEVICQLRFPTIMAIARHRKPTLKNEDYFDHLEQDTPMMVPESREESVEQDGEQK